MHFKWWHFPSFPTWDWESSISKDPSSGWVAGCEEGKAVSCCREIITFLCSDAWLSWSWMLLWNDACLLWALHSRIRNSWLAVGTSTRWNFYNFQDNMNSFNHCSKKGNSNYPKNPSSWGTWVRKANLILVYLGKQPSVWSPPPPLRFIFSTFCTSFDPLLPPIPSNHSNHSETLNGYNSETETEIESYGNLYFQ